MLKYLEYLHLRFRKIALKKYNLIYVPTLPGLTKKCVVIIVLS